jgi:hypothetical protein
LAFFKQLFITAAEAFLDNGHGDNHPYGSIWSAHVTLFEQRRKNGFVYLGGHICIKQIMPPVGIIILFCFTLSHLGGRRGKQVKLRIFRCLLEHDFLIFNGIQYTIFCLMTMDFKRVLSTKNRIKTTKLKSSTF